MTPLAGHFGQIVRMALLVVFLAFFSACSATGALRSHPEYIRPIVAAVEQSKPVDLGVAFSSERTSADAVLYNMEYARIAQLLGNFSASKGAFFTVMELNEKNDQKAVISASDVGAGLAAVLVNDGARPYAAAGYERVMTHHYQALNFLTQRSVEGASVEIRRACAEQNAALKRFEDEVEKVRKQAGEKGVKYGGEQVPQEYAQIDEALGKVKNSFQNAYTFYLSGVIYEALGMHNDAYIDYKKALEIFPNNKHLQDDVLRLASGLRMLDDAGELEKRFGRKPRPSLNSSTGELVLLLESGFIPQKEEWRISLLVGGKLVKVAAPIYRAKGATPPRYTVKVAGEDIGSPEVICDFYALAAKALREQAPMMVTRQILRTMAKLALQKEAEKRFGRAGALASGLYTALSERADLRSWLTLPAAAQVLRAPLTAGEHKIALTDTTGTLTEVEVEIVAGKKTILYVTEANRRVICSVAIPPI